VKRITLLVLPLGMACMGDGSEIDEAELLGEEAELLAPVLFENPDRVFKWKASCDCIDTIQGAFLDLTRAPEEQDGEPVRPSIEFFKVDSSIGNSTSGGFWFRGMLNADDGPRSAFFAAGEDFVIEGSDVDTRVTPPLLKQVGDTVGPDDRWVNGEADFFFDGAGVQTAHFRDSSGESGPDQIWFTDGIVGVRFRYRGGIHYGFVELEWRQPDTIFRGRYRPLRWGYNSVPGEALVIPP